MGLMAMLFTMYALNAYYPAVSMRFLSTQPIHEENIIVTTWLGDGNDLANHVDGAIKLISSIRRVGGLPAGIKFAIIPMSDGEIEERTKRDLTAAGWTLLPPASGAAPRLAKLNLWNLTGYKSYSCRWKLVTDSNNGLLAFTGLGSLY